MRSMFAIALLASAVAGCTATGQQGPESRGLSSLHEPVVERTTYAFDVASPGGSVAPYDLARLDGWFQGLGLGYGDTIYVDGSDASSARRDVASVVGRYGLLMSAGTPVTSGSVAPGFVRVVVSRARASVPGCPNWNEAAQPNFANHTMSNFGCSVNAAFAAQVANPEELVRGRAGPAASDGVTGAKAVALYRDWPLTAIIDGQVKRPLKRVDDTTTKGQQ
ncbi:MAG: CpaD family pilus assembly protein [Vicinamibacterales bacterium]